jgi:hypothetical protein
MIDFTNIKFLQYGSERQIEVYQLLQESKLLILLEPYNPILVGSIPLQLDLPASDVDIICQFKSKNQFMNHISRMFNQEAQFIVKEFFMYGIETVTANFQIKGVEVELFAQEIPTKEQMGYKHLLIEYELLKLYGEPFRKQILELKKNGSTTEEAICKILGIEGNPYISLIDKINY